MNVSMSVSNQMGSFGRNVLRELGQEIQGIRNLKIPFSAGSQIDFFQNEPSLCRRKKNGENKENDDCFFINAGGEELIQQG